MICKGRLVTFETMDGAFLATPRDWLLWHDTEGDFIGQCVLLVAPGQKHFKGRSSSDSDQQEKLDRYYGDSVKDWKTLLVDIPQGGWKPMGLIRRILYVRDGEYAGRYQHPFAEPQQLYECLSPPAVKIDLGECVWNHRGIVSP